MIQARGIPEGKVMTYNVTLEVRPLEMSLKTKSGKNPGQRSRLGLTYVENVHKTSWSNCFLQK